MKRLVVLIASRLRIAIEHEVPSIAVLNVQRRRVI